jgi:hypothetical protein
MPKSSMEMFGVSQMRGEQKELFMMNFFLQNIQPSNLSSSFGTFKTTHSVIM